MLCNSSSAVELKSIASYMQKNRSSYKHLLCIFDKMAITHTYTENKQNNFIMKYALYLFFSVYVYLDSFLNF